MLSSATHTACPPPLRFRELGQDAWAVRLGPADWAFLASQADGSVGAALAARAAPLGDERLVARAKLIALWATFWTALALRPSVSRAWIERSHIFLSMGFY